MLERRRRAGPARVLARTGLAADATDQSDPVSLPVLLRHGPGAGASPCSTDDDLLDLLGDPRAIGKDVGRDARPDGPARGVLAVSSLTDVSESYELSRAELDDMLAVPPLASPDIQALLARVLPKDLRRSA